jgi:hypothetical protein
MWSVATNGNQHMNGYQHNQSGIFACMAGINFLAVVNP